MFDEFSNGVGVPILGGISASGTQNGTTPDAYSPHGSGVELFPEHKTIPQEPAVNERTQQDGQKSALRSQQLQLPASRKRKFVVLTVTERCNLNCLYCFEKAKTGAVMEMRVAQEALECEVANSNGFEDIEVDLFGGEPTLYKDFLVELVTWTQKRKFNKPVFFFLETNGTLVHGEFQNWLLRNRHCVNVGLSLDGSPETHNITRSNSYARIDSAFFARSYPEQPVRMTIYNATVGGLRNDVVHLHRLGFKSVDASFACGINWDTGSVLEELGRELEKLCNYYLEYPQMKECSIFDIHLPQLLRRGYKLPKRCGAGTSMVSIATDGRRFPCHTFQPNTTDNPIELASLDFSKIDDFRDRDCSGCAMEPACPTCYGINHRIHGNIIRRDKDYCKVMKLRILAVSYLRAKQIERGLKTLPPAELYQTIKAIQLVQEELSLQTTKPVI